MADAFRQTHRPSAMESDLLYSADTIMKMMEMENGDDDTSRPTESENHDGHDEDSSDDDDDDDEAEGISRRPSLTRMDSQRNRFGVFLKSMAVPIGGLSDSAVLDVSNRMNVLKSMLQEAPSSKTAVDIQKLAIAFQRVVIVRDRSKKMKTKAKSRKNVFVGREAVDEMVWYGLADTREEAVEIGRRLMKELDLFVHVKNDHDFCDKKYSYKFKREIKGSETYVPKTSPLAEKAEEFQAIVSIEDRKHHRRTYKRCFVGKDAIDAMIQAGMSKTRADAVRLGRKLEIDLRLFKHVSGDHSFKDGLHFYEFREKGKHEAMYNTKTDDRLREPKTLERFYASDDQDVETRPSRSLSKRSMSYRKLGGGEDGISKLTRHGERGPRQISVISGVENAFSCKPQLANASTVSTEGDSDIDTSDSEDDTPSEKRRSIRRIQSHEPSTESSAPVRQTSINSRLNQRLRRSKNDLSVSDHVTTKNSTWDGTNLRESRRQMRLRRSASFKNGTVPRARSNEDLPTESRNSHNQPDRPTSVRRVSSDEGLRKRTPANPRLRLGKASISTSETSGIRRVRSNESLRRVAGGIRRSRSNEGLRRDAGGIRRSRSSERLRSETDGFRRSRSSEGRGIRRSRSGEGIRDNNDGVRRSRSKENLRGESRSSSRTLQSSKSDEDLKNHRRRESDPTLLNDTINDLKRSLSAKNLTLTMKINSKEKVLTRAIAA